MIILQERKFSMDMHKGQIELTSDVVKELIKNLEPGTMITLEMSVKTAEGEEESDPD